MLSFWLMKQMITRIDEALDRLLKARAEDEGRSVNSLVTEILDAAVSKESPRDRLRRRLAAEGRLYVPPRPKGPVPSRDEVVASLRGAGTAVIEALEEDRNRR